MKVKTHLKAGQNGTGTSVSQNNSSMVTVNQTNESTIGPPPV
jgi:hypothetical protein